MIPRLGSTTDISALAGAPKRTQNEFERRLPPAAARDIRLMASIHYSLFTILLPPPCPTYPYFDTITFIAMPRVGFAILNKFIGYEPERLDIVDSVNRSVKV